MERQVVVFVIILLLIFMTLPSNLQPWVDNNVREGYSSVHYSKFDPYHPYDLGLKKYVVASYNLNCPYYEIYKPIIQWNYNM